MSVEPGQPSGDLVRASDSDREQIQGILQDALAQGRITPDEYGDRSATTLQARTMGELRAVIDDLPVAAMRPDLVPEGAAGETVEWGGSFSSLKRKGAWTVPRKIVLRRRMGSVELDFTEARFTSPAVDIELDIVGGSVEIRVPADTAVSMDEVVVAFGSAEDHRRDVTTPGRTRLRLTGSVRLGSLEVRGPKWRLFG